MSKDTNVTLSIKGTRRALNDVQFADIVRAMAAGEFEARGGENVTRNFTFYGGFYKMFVRGTDIAKFLGDVDLIVSENAQYEREEADLRRANREFADEHVRLSERIAALAGENAALTARLSNANEACVTWEQRHTNIKAKLAAKDELLNAAGCDLEALREQNAQLAAARNNQRNTIIGMQQRLAAFDAEATRLRAEIGEERAARRQEAANAAREINLLREANEAFALSSLERDCREANNAREYLTEIQRLRGELNVANSALSSRNEELAVATAALEAARKELASSGRTLAEHTHNHGEDAAQYAVNAYDAAGKAARVVLTFCADGSVVLDTGDGPVTINGKVDMNGNLQTTGALSS